MTDDRVLPFDLETERAVLGACLINPAALDKVRGTLTPGHFFRRAHELIFAAILTLSDRRIEPDIMLVAKEIDRVGELEEIGGPAYVAQLTDGVPRSSNIIHYAALMRETYARRQVIKAANQMLVDAYEGERRAEEIVRDADKAIIELQRGSGPGRMVDLRQKAGEMYEWVEHQVKNAGQITGVTSGFPSIDDLTLGWQQGDMIVMAARPSIGKTAMVMNFVTNAARAGVICAVFSLEMRTRQLQYRQMSNLATVPLRSLMRGEIVDTDYAKITTATGFMHDMPIFVDDRGGQTIWDIRAACRRLRAEHGLGLVVIDYMQLMPGSLDRRGATRNDEMTDISRRVKALADEVSVPILAISQMSRAGEQRTDKRPQLSDLRESGSLEQDADIVIFLHRKHHRAGGPTAVIFEKQRNGPTGTLKFEFDRRTQTYVDKGPDEQPADDETPPPAEEPTTPTKPRGWKRGR